MKVFREIVRHPDASIRCERFDLPAFRGELHRHSHAELTWIQKGCGLRWVGDHVEYFAAGDLVLLGAEIPHLWFTPDPNLGEACKAVVVQFPQEWAATTGLIELSFVERVLIGAVPGLSIRGALRVEVQQRMARMVDVDPPRRIAAFIEILASIHDALVLHSDDLKPLARTLPTAQRNEVKSDSRSRRYDRVLNWINLHLAEEITVTAVAAIAGITPASFNRFFLREFGKGLTEFLNDARCSLAALKLLQTRDPIATIAHECGYPTLSNFGAQFQRRFGVSPKQYRKNRRMNHGQVI